MSLASRLASRRSRKAAERARPGGSVRGYVKAHLAEILAAHADLPWDEIAAAIAEEGVVWRNGQPPSGKDLRTLVCRLRKDNASKAIAQPAPQRAVQRTTAPLPTVSPGSPKPSAGRDRILAEMRQATRERS